MKRIILIIMAACLIAGSIALFYNENSQAQPTDNSAAIMQKLDTVITNQQAILKKLDDMTKELNIIKIRSSRS